MKTRVLMFQGTGSDVGKSTLVAGLCRIARRKGIRVAPFKPQNMSNNAAACADGGEIGRAQALQARAAGLAPHTDFNPVLLKPQCDQSAQVVVHGKMLDTVSASEYMYQMRSQLLQAVVTSFKRLCQNYELILVEGAGSAAEINLRERDIANMGFARCVGAPVCLIGDIDRGGVIAAVVGTKTVIDSADAAMIKSFVINRFRGDPRLFDDGVLAIEQQSGWPCRGVVPWLASALKLPQEDAVVLHNARHLTEPLAGKLTIAVPMLSRIANFDDLDPLSMEPNVDVVFVAPGQTITQDVDAIIIPGTKSAIGDLAFLRTQGWDHDIIAFARNGGHIMGICGGYQMLGHWIHDSEGFDGPADSVQALGLLDVSTCMQDKKQIREVRGKCLRSHSDVAGYEIHVGSTSGPDTNNPTTILEGRFDGATDVTGRVEGTYLHGIFTNDSFRSWWIDRLKAGMSSALDYEASIEEELERLADGLEDNLDVNALFNDACEPVFQ